MGLRSRYGRRLRRRFGAAALRRHRPLLRRRGDRWLGPGTLLRRRRGDGRLRHWTSLRRRRGDGRRRWLRGDRRLRPVGVRATAWLVGTTALSWRRPYLRRHGHRCRRRRLHGNRRHRLRSDRRHEGLRRRFDATALAGRNERRALVGRHRSRRLWRSGFRNRIRRLLSLRVEATALSRRHARIGSRRGDRRLRRHTRLLDAAALSGGHASLWSRGGNRQLRCGCLRVGLWRGLRTRCRIRTWRAGLGTSALARFTGAPSAGTTGATGRGLARLGVGHRHCRFGRCGDDHLRRRGGRAARLQSLHFGLGQRLAGGRRQRGFARDKGDRRWRRCGARDDRATGEVRLRPGGRCSGSDHAALDRRHGDDLRHRRAEYLFGVQPHGGARDRLRLDEGRRRHRDHRTGHLLVDICDIARTVVDVGDVDVVDHRVAAVDTGEIVPAHHIRRPIDFARPERKPAYSADVAAGNRKPEVTAADEGDQRGRVDGLLAHRSRDPAPCTAEIRPASIVRYGESPRRVIDPGPAPRLDPRPVPVAVRCPARRHARRHPHGAIAGDGAPRTVGVEVLITDHVGRNIA